MDTPPEDQSQPKILIVDDESANVQLLEMVLERAGFTNLKSTTDPREVLAIYHELNPDIVLLDLTMPHYDGFEVMAQLRAAMPRDTYLPILVLTAVVTPEARRKALGAGANDFLTKPFDVTEVLLRVRNLLETRRLHVALQDYNEVLDQTVKERTDELRKALVELRETQHQIVQQERLRALGVMAGGVSHDFNNVLSIVLGFGELVLADCHAHPELKHNVEAMEAIITAAQDGARMVTRLREFYRPDASELRLAIDLNDLAAQAITLTEPRWRSQALALGLTIKVSLEGESRIPSISGDPAELREAVTNLIFNAVDAMPDGGTITVRTRASSESVTLEIADTGAGMTDEVRQRCLEPFFTTKGEKGTGLGLAMVYGIVQRHGATMDIVSELGCGTTFRFVFPAHRAEPGKGETPELNLARPLKILVVDDEPFIGEILTHLLAQDCHIAESVSDSDEALDRIKSDHFDLMITDHAMPSMTGGQLAVAVRQASPATRIMLLTGFGADERPEDGGGAIDLVVGKPVTREALRQAVLQVTASGTPSHIVA